MKNKKSLGQIAFEAYEKLPHFIGTKQGCDIISKAVELEVCRRMSDDWIRVSERRPTKKDADNSGAVMVWLQDKFVSTFRHYLTARDLFQYWQPCPKAPKKIGKKGRR